MIAGYTSVKTFSTTRFEQRAALGETVTKWLAEHPQLEVVEALVVQSSDVAVHCLSCVLFLRERRE